VSVSQVFRVQPRYCWAVLSRPLAPRHAGGVVVPCPYEPLGPVVGTGRSKRAPGACSHRYSRRPGRVPDDKARAGHVWKVIKIIARDADGFAIPKPTPTNAMRRRTGDTSTRVGSEALDR
jgi:hypothetical protein